MRVKTIVAAGLVAAGTVGAVGVAWAFDHLYSPIAPPKAIDLGKVELGKKLYFDPRLSKSGFISCNSCHNLSMGGTDNLRSSIGHNWNKGPISAPTVLNSSFNIAQFWDGRAADLKAQAGGPIAKPGEMASTHDLAINVIRSIPQYQAEFARAFGSPGVDIGRVTGAIAEFEKTLVTPNSRFDQWLGGKADALTAGELEGYQLFKNSGCVACHNGPAVGGGSFQKFGVVAPYKADSPAQGRVGGRRDGVAVWRIQGPDAPQRGQHRSLLPQRCP